MNKQTEYICEGCSAGRCRGFVDDDECAPDCCWYGGGTKKWTRVDEPVNLKNLLTEGRKRLACFEGVDTGGIAWDVDDMDYLRRVDNALDSIDMSINTDVNPDSVDKSTRCAEWRKEACSIMIRETGMPEAQCMEIISSFDDEIIASTSPQEAIDDELSYWGDDEEKTDE